MNGKLVHFTTPETDGETVVVTCTLDPANSGYVDINMDGIMVAFFNPRGILHLTNFIINDPEYLRLVEKGVPFEDNKKYADGGRSIIVDDDK